MFITYYRLAKPGIIRGNAVTATAGFFLAAQSHFNFALFVAMLAGLSLVIASGCVFNNYIDRGIDKKMARTRQRALVSGAISGRAALLYASLLGVLGTAILGYFTNLLTMFITLTGFVFYVVIYGYWKRKSVHGTLVGSVSGAVPPVVGYTAVSGQLDWAALILFLILVLWQMPHFYAIALYRSKDYAAASIPVLPVKKGVLTTKIQILLYIALFTVAASTLSIFGYASHGYLAVAIVLGVSWLGLGLRGFRAADTNRWAHTMFFYSLIVITVLCTAISVDALV
ncbi:MAG: heme o synthase [Candidatus Saccharimonadales bacterium]